MKETPKVIDLERGKLLVVSDLHGNEEDYRRVWELYAQLKEAGKANTLVFLGDLIHSRKEEDASMFMIQDLIRRKANQPGGEVYALLGNHEMVHIYHIELWKGGFCYTQSFEDAILPHRAEIVKFFCNMPFAIRTKGGVLLNHTGPSGLIGQGKYKAYEVEGFEDLRDWSHRAFLDYASLEYAIPEPDDDLYAEIGSSFMRSLRGEFLWEFLMNKNERRYPDGYGEIVNNHLAFMSKGHAQGLTVMVNGHVQVPEGMEIVDPGQLRLSSGYGAHSNREKTVLLFKAKRRYETAADLAKKAFHLFESDLPSASSAV